MKDRVVISGYFGMGNTGDEAVLAGMVRMLRKRRPNLPITVLSGAPGETRARFGVDAVGRMSPLTLLALRGAALVISGGGSLIQDRTSFRSLSYYLSLLKTARRWGARTMVFAQGVGPLVTEKGRRLAQEVLSQVDAITVRDAESLELLQELGVGRDGTPPIEVAADAAFAVEPEITDRVRALAPQRPAIAVSLRPWEGVDALLEPIENALAYFEGQAALVAWPLHPAEDLPLCEELKRRLPAVEVIREPLTPGEWMALAGWTDVVVGMRLHALIFAASRAVPVLGISYDPKVDALLGRLRGRPVGQVGEPLDAQKLKAAIDAALSEDETRRRDREARAEHLRSLAGRSADRALELLARR